MTRWFDLFVFVAALSSVGVGIAMKDPPLALVAVGGIVLSLVVLARFHGVRKE